MRTTRNLIAVVFFALLFSMDVARLDAAVDCWPAQYQQQETMCYMHQECTWNAGTPNWPPYPFWDAQEDFEWAVNCYDEETLGGIYDYIEGQWGGDAQLQAFACYEHCPSWFPSGCGTFGLFEVYDAWVGTCPE